jgi:hypothetical protein
MSGPGESTGRVNYRKCLRKQHFPMPHRGNPFVEKQKKNNSAPQAGWLPYHEQFPPVGKNIIRPALFHVRINN